ncbi:MAG: pyridoxal 5'-phosphate synthase glutaminase subunit PdxT [Chloroflexi bacterium]|nr:pyridoxal 5'-phosphate synthase glutaminase subunit PdxT [Chloroflexota bacterium]
MRLKRVGVLAMQGAFAEHAAVLRSLGAEASLVRLPEHLSGLDGLIIPGGESTTIGRLTELWGLEGPIRDMASRGLPIMGTCAGLILLSKRASTVEKQPPLALLDVEVKRNAYGRQVDSFETELSIPALGQEPFPAVFIRAPVIEAVGSPVEALARLDSGSPVAVRQGNVLGTTFHPELTEDSRLHAYFLDLMDGRRSGG